LMLSTAALSQSKTLFSFHFQRNNLKVSTPF